MTFMPRRHWRRLAQGALTLPLLAGLAVPELAQVDVNIIPTARRG